VIDLLGLLLGGLASFLTLIDVTLDPIFLGGSHGEFPFRDSVMGVHREGAVADHLGDFG
jgi:hypothetical protein